jgi:DNA-binding response OmpR family regulator
MDGSGQSSILIVDDDMDYSCLVRVAFQDAHVTNPVEVLNDGWSAVKHLNTVRNAHTTDNDGLPILILLDLAMPKLSGLEVLNWIRSQPELAAIPVLVFTGIEAGTERMRAMQSGAASMYVKPSSYRELVRQIEEIRDSYLEPREVAHAD